MLATVTAGSSAEIVVPAMEKAEGFGVNIWLATANAVVVVVVGDGL